MVFYFKCFINLTKKGFTLFKYVCIASGQQTIWICSFSKYFNHRVLFSSKFKPATFSVNFHYCSMFSINRWLIRRVKQKANTEITSWCVCLIKFKISKQQYTKNAEMSPKSVLAEDFFYLLYDIILNEFYLLHYLQWFSIYFK